MVGSAISRIHQGDCVAKLGALAPGSVDLVFADPPFNIGYDYDLYDDARSAGEYLDWSKEWLRGVFGVLKRNGTFWLAIGDEYAAELKVAAREVGFTCRSWVIWYYTFGVNCRRGYSRSHTHLFHFVVDPQDFTFNVDNPAVRVPSARQLVYADARANPKGRLPDNTWIYRPQDLPNGFSADHDTWYFPRVAGTFKEREGFHGCQMPEQLLARIIRTCSNPMDVVLDPFAGSGTTLAVARKLGRQWVGIELSGDYVRRIRQRLRDLRVGEPLNGSADPLKSAPTTRKGKAKGVLRGGRGRRRPRTAKADLARQEIHAAVVAAYKSSSDGFSTDYLLADPARNARFVDQCKTYGIAGDAVVWNQTLLRLRKQGKLPRVARKQPRMTFQMMDAYSFASEVALQQLSVSFDVTIDELLCDPELAGEFDRIAQRFAPGQQTPLEFRWAALTLRKRAKIAKRLAGKYRPWLSSSLPRTLPIGPFHPTNLDGPGVYILIGRDKRSLYVGETYELAERIGQIKETPAWQDLELSAVRCCPESELGMHGLKSVLIQRVNPALNSHLLFPRIAHE
ncbi:MAG: site-specific DNA-methyltransferase [Planctomycetia bacterium]|nr:MAG: site-specific DNA-methyltransferase [Planctomycetia bacterium]